MSTDGPPPVPKNRLGEARKAAQELVDALESGTTMITECLLKAQRLARIQRDVHAQTWIRLELSGYPEELGEHDLGWCSKYAWRFTDGKLTLRTSLPEFEANVGAMKIVLEKLNGPTISEPVIHHGAAAATLRVMESATATLVAHRDVLARTIATFQRMKAHVHSYATDVLISLELGDVAESIFEQARARVDQFVSARCPEAAQQIVAVNDRMRENAPESRSAALTACRRLINTVADRLFPPRNEPHIDGGGKSREVGKEAYKNRLDAYIEQRLASKSTGRILKAELTHLVDRVDAIYEKSCKGVHDQVSAAEAQLVIMETYVLLGELAQLAENDPVPSPPPVAVPADA